jgi:hypothetical protein
VTDRPWSFRKAAFRTRRRAASIDADISAIMNWIAWNAASGWPKALRCRA